MLSDRGAVAFVGHVLHIKVVVIAANNRSNDFSFNDRRVERTETHQRAAQAGSFVKLDGMPEAAGVDLHRTRHGFAKILV